jgi:hypothetical protein
VNILFERQYERHIGSQEKTTLQIRKEDGQIVLSLSTSDNVNYASIPTTDIQAIKNALSSANKKSRQSHSK